MELQRSKTMKRDRTANFQLQMQHSWILGYLGLRVKHPDPKRFSLVTNRTPNSSHAILFFFGEKRMPPTTIARIHPKWQKYNNTDLGRIWAQSDRS